MSIPHSLQPRAKLPLSVLALLTPWRYIFSETHQMFSVENHHLANEELLQSFTFQFFSSRLIFEPGEIGVYMTLFWIMRTVRFFFLIKIQAVERL